MVYTGHWENHFYCLERKGLRFMIPHFYNTHGVWCYVRNDAQNMQIRARLEKKDAFTNW